MSQQTETAPELGAVRAPASHGARQASADVEGTWRPDSIAWLIGLLGVFVVCYSLWWVSRLGDTSQTDRFTGAAVLPAGLLAVALCIRLRRVDRLDPKTRQMWSLVGVAFGVLRPGRAALRSPVLRRRAWRFSRHWPSCWR